MKRTIALLIFLFATGCLEAPTEEGPTTTPDSDASQTDMSVDDAAAVDQGSDVAMCDPVCAGDLSICDDGVCVACVMDSDCSDSLCVGGECVECSSSDDCESGFCDDSGVCVECRESADCPDNSPVCLGEGENARCVQCTVDEDEYCTDSQVCDGETNSCVACLLDRDCTDPAEARCDTVNNTCESCDDSLQCEGIGDTETCNRTSGKCVECVPSTEEADCGNNTCDPGTFTCTDVRRNSLELCEPCDASSQCIGDAACVLMNFDGTPAGSFCALLQPMNGSCLAEPSPYVRLVNNAQTVEGGLANVCTIDQMDTTCVAVRDYLDSKSCSAADGCGDNRFEDGLCYNGFCTLPCGASRDCLGDCAAADTSGSSMIPDEPYCSS